MDQMVTYFYLEQTHQVKNEKHGVGGRRQERRGGEVLAEGGGVAEEGGGALKTYYLFIALLLSFAK